MKSIKLHINKLGLIRDADLEITPMMVFSGESGLGKSYLAILCHYFFHVWLNPRRLHNIFIAHEYDFLKIQDTLKDKEVVLRLKKSELELWLQEDSIDYLRYMLGHKELQASINVFLPEELDDEFVFEYEREIIGFDNNEDVYSALSIMHLKYRFKKLGLNDESPLAYVLRFAMIQELFGYFQGLLSSFVLPPSRGTYMIDEVQGISGLSQSFLSGMKELENVPEIKEIISPNLINLFRTVLDGQIERRGDKYVYLSHEDEMPISAAAASVREIAPMQLLIEKKDISRTAILIEEPEAHLHPLKQRMMADIVAMMASGGASMQITTHSDYFIRRLNEYVSLANIKNRKGDDIYNTACKELGIDSQILFPVENLSAYLLMTKDGEITKVVRQSINYGVPFSTFTKAIDGSMTNSLYIDQILEEDDCNE